MLASRASFSFYSCFGAIGSPNSEFPQLLHKSNSARLHSGDGLFFCCSPDGAIWAPLDPVFKLVGDCGNSCRPKRWWPFQHTALTPAELTSAAPQARHQCSKTSHGSRSPLLARRRRSHRPEHHLG